MTLEEAEKIATIAETADGGCPYCVGSIVEQLGEAFPEFQWNILGNDVEVRVREQ
jgi:hypothetical protein